MLDFIKDLFDRGDGFFRLYLRRGPIKELEETTNNRPELFYDGELMYIPDCKSLAVWDEEIKNYHLIHLGSAANKVFTRYYKEMK